MSIPTRTALWLGVAPVIFVATQASAQVVESPARPAANGNAPAQPVVSDDIVVTATKSGEQQLQKVPLAISAFSGAALETRGAVSLADVAKLTPGFNYTFNTVWAISSIRGIGTNNVFAGGDPSTTLQVDGVYYGRPTGANLDFVDVDRVEVLRGPQGTLYGRNAIGGTTNVITRDPTNELGGMVRGTLGNYALRRLEGEISVPIVSDLVSASIAGRISRRDGYIEELNPALPDQWNERREAVRGKIKITPSANLKLILAADYNHANEYYAPFNIRRSPVTPDGQDPGFFQTAQDAPDRDRMQQWGVSLRAEWDLGGATLTSITAYRHSFTTLESDLDFTELPLFHTRQFPEYQSQWSQEFNIAGKAGPVSYVAGLFGYRERVFSFYNASLFESLLITQGMTAITKSVAAFGQADYELVPGLKFTLGLRYTIDRKSAVNVDGTQSFDPPGAEGGLTSDLTQQAAGVSEIFRGRNIRRALTPKFGIQYQATPDILAYASITRGFKSGGYNLLISPSSIDAAEYGPETVWAYEAGLKTRIAPLNGTLNLAGFYYDYKGLQINQFIFLPDSVAQLVSNAKAANIKGVEAELALHPSQVVDVGGALAYLDARYKGNFPAIDNFTNTVIDPDGKRLNDAPKWAGNAYLQLNVPVVLSTAHLRVEGIYKSKVYYTPLNDIRLGANGRLLLNGSLVLDLANAPIQIGVRANNITNKKYIVATYYGFTAGAQPGEPRTVLGFISYKF